MSKSGEATISPRPAAGIAGVLVLLIAGLSPVHANNVAGAWSPVYSWPLIGIHAVLLPDGRVLTYGTKSDGTQTGWFIYDVWDPSAGTPADGHLTLPNSTNVDLFCSSQVVLPQGNSVFIAGGDNWVSGSTTSTGNPNTTKFNYATNSLTRSADMNRPRWYSTSTMLTNGEVYIQGGSGGDDRPEVREAGGTFRLLSGVNTSAYDFQYPRNWVAPDGRIFGYDSTGAMYYVNAAGNGALTAKGTFSGPHNDSASAAMFRPGRILQFGGSSSGAIIIDINSGSPVVTTTSSMSSRRILVNATILADGKVLATGGSTAYNEMTGVNYTAEIWDPDTGRWTVGASEVKARLYHSTALLLPDATVLVAGGGAKGPQNNTNVEIYKPPYLFAPDGGLAARPGIVAAPDLVEIGETFPVDFAGGSTINRVALIKTGSVTHSFNMEQRFMDATFTVQGNRLMVQAPRRAADAPPGYYHLFLLNSAGVPSVSRIFKIDVAPISNPAVTPVLTSPANRSDVASTAVSLQIAATDPNGDILGYAASGLPPGVTINDTTGLISGTPATPGTYNVIVAASDGVNSATAGFVWTVTQVDPLVLNPLPVATPAVNGTSVTFTATAGNGVNPRFRWFFDDGTPPTAWLTTGTIQHTFTGPGIYYVTVTVTDDRGIEQFATITKTVHLPLTTSRPAASANIVYATRAGGDRVWVVNQDNDSVSALDAATGNRLAEIPVGNSPRSLAVGPDGRIWVTNKGSASISLIDPATLAVTGTLPLPRASAPYGIAFDAAGANAWVALEGTGRLLKLDAVTGALVAAADVGPAPRHLAISSDGGTVYVSSFITPRLPGEETATVTPGTSGAGVITVRATDLHILGTIVLHQSDRPDAENQGSGMPNYLGAPVISPDGSQAFVPSKQDNVGRGQLRNGKDLNFQNTVRAVSSRIDLGTGNEDPNERIDHDNAGLASAVAFDPTGVYMFVSLETSREVAVIDAYGRSQVMRFGVGRAPQGLVVSPDGSRLFVNNFMDRTVGIYDLALLLVDGTASVPLITTRSAIGTDQLSPRVLLGKQLFYDAADPRLARDGYVSCAACHNDGGHDGRVWDLTGFGEGLRNTVSLRGRAGAQGFLHWSGNFDEVQDFEGQIRSMAGGTGLMSDAAFTAGTRNQPLGDPKAGQSADLDALAAYVSSLTSFAASPYRAADGSLTASGLEGRMIFASLNCAACHGGNSFTNSAAANLANVGTVKPASGHRLGGPLSGIDVPTLRDVWMTAPYLHDGSAATLEEAVRAHAGVTVSDTQLPRLVAYLQQIGSEDPAAPVADADQDGIADALDNCTTVSNPDQRDTNGDGYGNICDADLNNDGRVTTADYGLQRSRLGTADADADLDGSGLVTTADYGILRSRLGEPPGPAAPRPAP